MKTPPLVATLAALTLAVLCDPRPAEDHRTQQAPLFPDVEARAEPARCPKSR
jgi:hypothetical protein